VRALATIAGKPEPTRLAEVIERKLTALGIPSGVVPHAALVEHLYFPAQEYVRRRTPKIAAAHGATNSLGQAMVDAECAYIRLLQDVEGVSAPAIGELALSIVRDLQQWWPSALKSEYWTARFATFILPLGFRDTACRNLIDVGKRSIQVFWLLRFAHLLVTYGFRADAGNLLDAIHGSPHKIWLDEFAHSKLVELNAQTGRMAAAYAGIDALLGSPKLSTALTLTIAMTAVRIEDPDRLKRALMRLGMNGRERSGDVFTVLSAAAVRSA